MAEPSKPTVEGVELKGINLDQDILDAAFRAVREHANRSNYGRFISDAECRAVATEVVTAIADFQSGKAI